jgi:hypothetical protein
MALRAELDRLALLTILSKRATRRNFRLSRPAAGGRENQTDATSEKGTFEPIHRQDPP